MKSLWDRISLEGAEPRLRTTGLPPVAEIVRTIMVGKTPDASGLAPLDRLAVLAFVGLGGSESLGPALVQQAPPHPGLEPALGEASLAQAFPGASRASLLALGAGLLQIHDFWGPSHVAAQAADDLGETRFSAYWHGIAHRREPDAGNASYWFRRVGRHSLFQSLGVQARPILVEHGDSGLTGRLLGSAGWNPEAMIDLCVAARAGSSQEVLARRLQRLEMQQLVDATAAAVSPA
jgi:hypothetical protein